MKKDKCAITTEKKYASIKNKYFTINNIIDWRTKKVKYYNPDEQIGKNGYVKSSQNRTLVILEEHNKKAICFQVTTTRCKEKYGMKWLDKDTLPEGIELYISYSPLVIKKRNYIYNNFLEIPKYLKRRLIKNLMNISEKDGEFAYYKHLVKAKKALHSDVKITDEEIRNLIEEYTIYDWD